ncbi:MAG TPA: hypothetical protein VLI54_01745 [Bacillota bacterium]|nr:hypothetical protein [Bacillota bacterium]
MPIVHIKPFEGRAIGIRPERIATTANVARFIIQMFKEGGTAYTFKPHSVVRLVPDELQGRVPETWLQTHQGNPAERATAHVFETLLTGAVRLYDMEARTFTQQPLHVLPIPNLALPLAEASPFGGLSVHAITLHLPEEVLPPGRVQPFPYPA